MVGSLKEENKQTAQKAECPACLGARAQLDQKRNGTQLLICEACHMRFSFPMQHPGQAWYEQSAIYEEVEWNVPSLSKLASRWEFQQALKFMDPKAGGVFDVGCGRGDFLALAKDRGFEVAGTDLNKALLKVAKVSFGIDSTYSGSFEAYLDNHPHTQYGTVTAFEVMEHLPNPREFVEQCYSILKQGGRLNLSVPGYNRWPHWVNNEVDLPPHHLTLWSEKGLETLFMQAGFKDIRVIRKPLILGDLAYHAVRKLSFLNAPGISRKLGRGLLKIPLGIILLFLKLVPKSGGFTLFITGRKN